MTFRLFNIFQHVLGTEHMSEKYVITGIRESGSLVQPTFSIGKGRSRRRMLCGQTANAMATRMERGYLRD